MGCERSKVGLEVQEEVADGREKRTERDHRGPELHGQEKQQVTRGFVAAHCVSFIRAYWNTNSNNSYRIWR